jgi:two-component system chemotaxis sensor kinase CheA
MDFDPDILADFLMESGELLDQLDGDLVSLESTPEDEDLLNQIFRAMRTIKGSASFLGLKNLVDAAHAAEDVLNAARRGELVIDRHGMDLLLDATGLLRTQFEELENGNELSAAAPALIDGLHALCGNGPETSAAPTEETVAAPETPSTPVAADPDPANQGGETMAAPSAISVATVVQTREKLDLPESKADLLDFMVADLEETLDEIAGQIDHLLDDDADAAVSGVAERCDSLARTVAFFEFEQMAQLIALMQQAGDQFASDRGENEQQLVPRMRAITASLREQTIALREQEMLRLDLEPLVQSIHRIIDTGEVDIPVDPGADAAAALAALGVQIGAGSEEDAADAPPAGEASDEAAAPTAAIALPTAVDHALQLADSKADLMQFMIDDLSHTIEELDAHMSRLQQADQLSETCDAISETCTSLGRCAEFFDFDGMQQLVGLLTVVARKSEHASANEITAAMPVIRAVIAMLRQQAEALSKQQVRVFDCSGWEERLTSILEGLEVETDAIAPASAAPVQETPDTTQVAPVAAADAVVEPKTADTPAAKGDAPKAAAKGGGKTKIEQTIRVEVGRLEALLNLIGELVIQKNRVGALGRQVCSIDGINTDLQEAIAQASYDLDRVTGDLQVGVMKTRMQPLDNLFGKYPRMIRDLARKTDKNIRLDVIGGETEVDKSVIEELADPLVHLMRNAADHGVELPAERAEAGKPETGVITLAASHEGSHVLVRIMDDGKGLNADRLREKAVERGLVTEEEAANLSDREVFQFIFAPGFSCADKVSDISGRGVGMDVVRTNIVKLGGTIDLSSEFGQGTTVAIRIPLTVAILSAMMVRVGPELFAIPLTSILEIVKPNEGNVSTINSRPVMRLRDKIMPLVSMADLFSIEGEGCEPVEAPFAVVVGDEDQGVGLMVTQLIGQQEIVIKPLDDMFDRTGPISGATVRDDGGISLILDVNQVIREAAKTPAGSKVAVAST